jgi:hypothetical protein
MPSIKACTSNKKVVKISPFFEERNSRVSESHKYCPALGRYARMWSQAEGAIDEIGGTTVADSSENVSPQVC